MIKFDNKATYCISSRTLTGKIFDWLLSLEEIKMRISG